MISQSHNPYMNVALEKALFDTYVGDDLLVYLWVNQPCVIAGVNQNVVKELNFDYIKAHHILPLRRFSGGGCVYQDLGNLNYTFIKKGNDEFDASKFLKPIIKALKQFQIDAYSSGRNDLLVEEKKISGTAWFCENEKLLFHGTLMVDVNMDHLQQALTPSMEKLSKKGIDSVRSRVANLKDFHSFIDVESLMNAIVDQFEDVIYYRPIMDQEHQKLIYQLRDPNWIYHINQDGTIHLKDTYQDRPIDLYMKVEDGVILQVQVVSDDMDPYLKDRIERSFLHKTFSNLDVHAMLLHSK